MAASGTERVSCPACEDEFTEKDIKGHWQAHLHRTDEGDYTWQCACEAVPKHWHESTDAWDDLMLHMQQRHGIAIF